jgi:GTPase SAR1 family protein
MSGQVQRKETDLVDVSYTLLSIDKQNFLDTLREVASTINVQLETEGQTIPFVPPVDFDKMKHEDKLFLYGPSGCGKSRIIFEIIKEKIETVGNICIINPQNTIGYESGRMNLFELAGSFNKEDVILWDGFPDDFVTRDVDTARRVLEVLTSKNIKYLIVALKPKYLEIYRNISDKIAELYTHEVAFDKEKIKSIIKSCGTNIEQFTHVYRKYLSRELDNISRRLWQKEPIPLTVLNYLKELSAKEKKFSYSQGPRESLDVFSEADKLLQRSDYYEHQFALLSSIQERQSDTEFLYTLKISYELGFNRTFEVIKQLQRGIFNSISPGEPFKKLSTWIYLSGQYCSMHDTCRDAIKLNDFIRIKVMNYIITNFFELLPNEDNQVYSFGLFLGKNIQLVHRDTANPFLPKQIYDYMKRNRHFEFALDEDLQVELLRRTETDIEFARGLSSSLGRVFLSLDNSQQQKILTNIKSGLSFARFFGESLGRVFKYLPKDYQNNIFELMKENGQFADGIGMGLGSVFSLLDVITRKELFERAEKDGELMRGLGYGFGCNFFSFNTELQNDTLRRIALEGEFAKGVGMGLGHIYSSLPPQFQNYVFALAENNPKFAFGLGVYLGGFSNALANDIVNEQIIEKSRSNNEFAYGLGCGLGYAFGYMPRELQMQLFEKVQKETQFAFGLGLGFGYTFKNLPGDLQTEIFERTEKNSEFAKGVGSGLFYSFPHLSKHLQTEIFERTEKNSEFAKGVGMGFGYIYSALPETFQNQLIKRCEHNSEFAYGLGYGLRLCLSIFV